MNADGKIDMLSGSYSRMEQDMAGLFHVLWGTGDGFKVAEPLRGTDGTELVIPKGPPSDRGDDVMPRICTRPTAVDFDGDGDLDIVSGNFAGTFAYFAGEGEGRFAPVPTMLKDVNGAELRVDSHSDPVFADWDGDGDLDLLSGCLMGGVYLAVNRGTRTEPVFGAFEKLIPSAGDSSDLSSRVAPDDSHLTMPQTDTRIWVDDVDGDGKLDILVGDTVHLIKPADGLDVATAQAKYDELLRRQSELFAGFQYGENGPTEEQMNEQMKRLDELDLEFDKVVKRESTGYVWLYKRR